MRCVTRDGPGRSSSRPRRRTARAPQQAAGAKPPPCLLTVPGDATRSLRETAPAPRGQAHPASSGTRSVRPAGGHTDRTHGPRGAGVGCRARRGPPGTPTRCPPHLPAAPCAADASAVPMFTRCPKNSGTTFRLGQKQTPPWGTVADGVGPGLWTEAAGSAGLKAPTAADLQRSTPSLAAPVAVRGPRARQVAPEPRRLPEI